MIRIADCPKWIAGDTADVPPDTVETAVDVSIIFVAVDSISNPRGASVSGS